MRSIVIFHSIAYVCFNACRMLLLYWFTLLLSLTLLPIKKVLVLILLLIPVIYATFLSLYVLFQKMVQSPSILRTMADEASSLRIRPGLLSARLHRWIFRRSSPSCPDDIRSCWRPITGSIHSWDVHDLREWEGQYKHHCLQSWD